jgi:tetratricopeptide (TPR) repeat protein
MHKNIIEIFDFALEISPNNPLIYYERALYLFNSSIDSIPQNEEIIQLIKKAIRLNPTNIQVYK